jgi:hypothetical protein
LTSTTSTPAPYIRNTLNVDKNEPAEDALFDIYRVMRPGEPPTIDSGRSDVPVAVLRSMSAMICPPLAA